MILFKIKQRKVWHIANKWNNSHCGNAYPFNVNRARGYYNWEKDKEYSKKFDILTDDPCGIDEEFVEVIDTSEIPQDISDKLCKACVMQEFNLGEVRVIGADE